MNIEFSCGGGDPDEVGSSVVRCILTETVHQLQGQKLLFS